MFNIAPTCGNRLVLFDGGGGEGENILIPLLDGEPCAGQMHVLGQWLGLDAAPQHSGCVSMQLGIQASDRARLISLDG